MLLSSKPFHHMVNVFKTNITRQDWPRMTSLRGDLYLAALAWSRFITAIFFPKDLQKEAGSTISSNGV